MKMVMAIMLFLFVLTVEATCQSIDTVSARVVSMKILKSFLLVKVVSACNSKDTMMIISDLALTGKKKNTKKLNIGESYYFELQRNIVIASPTKKMSMTYNHVVVWTNIEPYHMKPRICINCAGYNINERILNTTD